jgi:signal transduction histidine kinase
MGELIDSILSLSRVTRNELHISNVDLSQLAATIIEELTMQEPTRHVDVSIKEGIIVRGDEHLLRVALENLLGNAWKFTSKRELAHIIFSYEDDAEQGRIYYVRDNGAGFDMSQAHRLFTAFQRLHTASDFPGTGIGLATVQRIIHRHGAKCGLRLNPNMEQHLFYSFTSHFLN